MKQRNGIHIAQDCIDINDRGLAYGDGVFETIASIGGVLHNWDLHWQRLQSGTRRLAIDLPEEHYFLERINHKLIQQADQKSLLSANRVIKIIVTRGQGGRGYLYPEPHKPTIIISVHAWPERAIADYHLGIRATLCQTCLAKQPALAGIKHLNRLEQVLARNEFSSSHFQEGIMLACSDKPLTHTISMDSLIIEGTSSNLFFVNNGCLLTPVIDTCGVQGTIRQAVLALAEQKGIPTEENHFVLGDLKNASEVFFTNSIFGILPVASITVSNDVEWYFDLQNAAGKSQHNLSSPLAMTINKALNRPATKLN